MSLYRLGPNINSHIIQYTSKYFIDLKKLYFYIYKFYVYIALDDMDVYEVLLNCVSDIGEGKSVSRSISVVLDILSPPSQIEAIAISLHTLNLSWVPPDSVELSSLMSIITYYPIFNFSENSTTIITDL